MDPALLEYVHRAADAYSVPAEPPPAASS